MQAVDLCIPIYLEKYYRKAFVGIFINGFIDDLLPLLMWNFQKISLETEYLIWNWRAHSKLKSSIEKCFDWFSGILKKILICQKGEIKYVLILKIIKIFMEWYCVTGTFRFAAHFVSTGNQLPSTQTAFQQCWYFSSLQLSAGL